VIGPTGAVRVMVATRPVDFRKGAEGLATLVRETMMADPFSGAVYVFRAKRADRIKLIFWDGTGLCLFAKRLEDGIFRWPRIEDGVMRLSAAQLSALIEHLYCASRCLRAITFIDTPDFHDDPPVRSTVLMWCSRNWRMASMACSVSGKR
jgi:transposase